jgi:hypothetical protein
VLNTLIELDNRRGQTGLWALENELRGQMPRLRPAAQVLAKAWLEAVVQYRATYYTETKLAKLFSQLSGRVANE